MKKIGDILWCSMVVLAITGSIQLAGAAPAGALDLITFTTEEGTWEASPGFDLPNPQNCPGAACCAVCYPGPNYTLTGCRIMKTVGPTEDCVVGGSNCLVCYSHSN